MLYNPRFVIQDMGVHVLRGWDVSIARTMEIQLSLAKRVVTENEVINPPHSIDGQGMAHPRRFN
jgi:deoxyinosine 3'endonuclease (endonuclease V)